jgi:hypothetical protein
MDPETRMTDETKFRVGQSVYLNTGRRLGVREVYEITRVLPNEGQGPSYRIKSSREPYERVALESQLERSAI